jgi:hypothetical protein
MSKQESSYNPNKKDPSCEQININSDQKVNLINIDISSTNKINLETTQEEYWNAQSFSGKREESKLNLFKIF